MLHAFLKSRSKSFNSANFSRMADIVHGSIIRAVVVRTFSPDLVVY